MRVFQIPMVLYNNGMRSLFRKHLAIPQDHGSWVFILSPLLVGLFVGKNFKLESVYLVIAAMGAFLIRQPLTIMVKAYSGRRSQADLNPALFWCLVYGVIILIALTGLVLAGFCYLFYLAIPGIPVFAWHLYLVSKRAERRKVGVEIIATGVLSLTAPAAYWIGNGSPDFAGWLLWLLTWLQSAGAIVYAYLRLEQREQAESPEKSEAWKMGRRAFLYTTFNLVLSLLLGIIRITPFWIFIPFLLQWAETLWGIFHPAMGMKPTAIGVRQLIVSSLWTILFILLWR